MECLLAVLLLVASAADSVSLAELELEAVELEAVVLDSAGDV